MVTRSQALAVGVCSSLLVAAQIVVCNPASAALSNSDYAYAGNGSQYGEWSKSLSRVRLVATAYSTMSPSRCIDSSLDWETGPHYDGRTVRSCRPGGTASTNPNNSGYWQEPFGVNATDMRRGGGAEISDSYANGTFAQYSYDGYTGTLGQAYDPKPRTCTDKWSRTRTLYNDGHFNTCDENSDPLSSSS